MLAQQAHGGIKDIKTVGHERKGLVFPLLEQRMEGGEPQLDTGQAETSDTSAVLTGPVCIVPRGRGGSGVCSRQVSKIYSVLVVKHQLVALLELPLLTCCDPRARGAQPLQTLFNLERGTQPHNVIYFLLNI